MDRGLQPARVLAEVKAKWIFANTPRKAARRVGVTLPHFDLERPCGRAGFHVWTKILSACYRHASASASGPLLPYGLPRRTSAMQCKAVLHCGFVQLAAV